MTFWIWIVFSLMFKLAFLAYFMQFYWLSTKKINFEGKKLKLNPFHSQIDIISIFGFICNWFYCKIDFFGSQPSVFNRISKLLMKRWHRNLILSKNLEFVCSSTLFMNGSRRLIFSLRKLHANMKKIFHNPTTPKSRLIRKNFKAEKKLLNKIAIRLKKKLQAKYQQLKYTKYFT